MLDILKSKIINWNQKTANEFHQMAGRDSHFGKYSWETTSDGVFLLRDVCCIFFKNDGMVYKLTNQFELDDWELHCKLYDRVSNYDNCKIEIPIYHNKININDNLYLYTEVTRPTTQYDTEFWNDAMLSKIDDDYMLELVEHVTIILSHMKEISPLLPEILPKRMYNGYEHCWIDFKKWKIPINEYVYQTTGNLYRTMLRLESSYGISLDKYKILKKAELKWMN